MRSVAEVIREKRNNRGWSAKVAATELQKFGVTISEKTLYGWETGRRDPSGDDLLALCQLYSIDTFVEFEDKNSPVPAEAETEDNAIYHEIRMEAAKEIITRLTFQAPENLTIFEADAILSSTEAIRLVAAGALERNEVKRQAI